MIPKTIRTDKERIRKNAKSSAKPQRAISPKGRETSDLKAGQFKVGEHVMLSITGDCCYHRKAFEEFEVIEVKPCSRFGGGRETVTFQRVPKRPKGVK